MIPLIMAGAMNESFWIRSPFPTPQVSKPNKWTPDQTRGDTRLVVCRSSKLDFSVVV